MKIDEIKSDLNKQLYEIISKRFDKLTPPQEKSIKQGLLKGKNLVVSAPTASGKTLVAEMAAVNNILNGRGKAVYIVPLKSLASEKYKGFKDNYPIKTAISVGDTDSSENWLDSYDMIVTTSEKMDSLLRHQARWVKEIGTVIIDEAHLITDPHRGPTLEILYVRLKHLIPKAQFISLSATISNDKELAEWMESGLVKSDFRPVKLEHGVYFSDEIHFEKKKSKIGVSLEREELELIDHTLQKKKQILFFLSSRRYAEALARNSKSTVKKHLTKEEIDELKSASEEILNALERPTAQCEKLAECIKDGVAFHHAGLVSKQRDLIEEIYKKRLLKCICATPTLAMGVNLPSFRIVIRDLKRYSGAGLDWIPVLEYHQMAGRAGRPDFDDHGEAITLARSEGEMDEIFDRYISAESEALLSKLAVEPVLRTHVLALISDLFIRNRYQGKKFFEKTFWAFQYKRMEDLYQKIENVIDLLIDWEFVEEVDDRLVATKIGKRVSELYIDPASAYYLINQLKIAKNTEPLSYLHLICRTNEMRPLLNINARNFADIEMELAKKTNILIEPEPSPFDLEYEEYLSAFRTALMFQEWINETPEGKVDNRPGIFEIYRVAPGTLRQKLYNADWLLYAIRELCRLLDIDKLNEIHELQLRMKHGIKQELVDLVKLKGIGRVRARMLYARGIKTKRDVKAAEIDKIKKILGDKIAEKIKSQV